jgi:uncharacterized GH25 family protein
LRKAWFMAGLSAAVVASSAAFAHDFWLQPARFSLQPGEAAKVALLIGHGQERERWSSDGRRILQFQSVSASGVADHRPQVLSRPSKEDHTISLAGQGAHVLLFASSHSRSELPARRFNAYLQEEGLTPALRLRAQRGAEQRPGREIYSRRAKAIVQVGATGAEPQPHLVRPLGLTLEIVPEVAPHALRGTADLPVRVYYEGRLLPGALVKLRDLNADAEPRQTIRTDASGRAILRRPGAGLWQVNVVWTKPLANHEWAEFDTTFSSLTFEIPRQAGAAR